ncbi:class I SAM-dependent methyltransferase [Trichocoleus desertorum AS-A10]|uniref:class I SAM-dependent methyltransferase n=1 Tax=Trichocoleus desertorum TaxID=1481672 RepID=UPI0032988A1A
MDTPLHTLKPLSRFSDRAVDYAKYRPSYPEAAIALLLQGLEEPSQLVAVDMGAGTGISSRLLAEHGVHVFAIEPNADMQQAATPHALVEFRTATAEQSNLPSATVDLVTCFQSFHWLQPEQSLAEFHRILKLAGRLALVWNERDRSDEFTGAYSRLMREASNHHPAEAKLGTVEPLLTSPYFTHIQHHTLPYQQSLDLAGLLGRAQSVSYAPSSGEAKEQLLSNLKQLHEHWADAHGLVQLAYQTNIYLAKPKL